MTFRRPTSAQDGYRALVLGWPSFVWILIGAEMFVLLYLRASYRSLRAEARLRLLQHDMVVGVTGQSPGIILPMIYVNLLAVLALWVAYRSGRYLDPQMRAAMMVTCLAASLVLAALTWNGLNLVDAYQPVFADALLELQPDGSYRVHPRKP